MAKMIMKKAH